MTRLLVVVPATDHTATTDIQCGLLALSFEDAVALLDAMAAASSARNMTERFRSDDLHQPGCGVTFCGRARAVPETATPANGLSTRQRNTLTAAIERSTDGSDEPIVLAGFSPDEAIHEYETLGRANAVHLNQRAVSWSCPAHGTVEWVTIPLSRAFTRLLAFVTAPDPARAVAYRPDLPSLGASELTVALQSSNITVYAPRAIAFACNHHDPTVRQAAIAAVGAMEATAMPRGARARR